MATKSRRTFWITSSVTGLHEHRVSLLKKNGFDVTFVSTTHDAIRLARDARPICIIIDSPLNNDPSSILGIQHLMREPELNGVRFIGSLSRQSPELVRIAVSENFRDLIPLAVPDIKWLQRILYANSAKFDGQILHSHDIGMSQTASVASSARIVWINRTHIRMECRGSHVIGGKLSISGAISKAFGVPHLNLTVERIENDRLLYRYSQAIICRWNIAPSNQSKAEDILSRFFENKPNHKLRAFVAVSRQTLRTTLAKSLNPGSFFVITGLQKVNLAHEVGYFTPNVLFIDDKLLETLSDENLGDIASRLPESSPIIIYGESSEKMIRHFSSHRIFCEPSIQQSHLENAQQRYEIKMDADPGPGELLCPIPSEHPWSRIGLINPARLTALSPSAGKLNLPGPIGDFTLATLDAPLLRQTLGRNPVIKIIANKSIDPITGFANEAAFYLADTTTHEESLLASALVGLISESFVTASTADASSHQKAMMDTDASVVSRLEKSHQESAGEFLGGGFSGPSALKESAGNYLDVSALKKTQTQAKPIGQTSLNKAPPGNVVLKTTSPARRGFKVDITIVKALMTLAIFTVILILALRTAEQIGSSRKNDLGKEYSDFFFRMNPELRKKSNKND
jgi:hypothetical protein